MKNTQLISPGALLLGLSVISLLLLLGCAAPKYQFCCAYEQAFPENPDDAVCWGADENGEYQTLEVISCDEEEYSCTALVDDEQREIPVCAYMETVECDTECAGVFCGTFFYDPRPSVGLIPDNQSHDEDVEEKESSGVSIDDPIGMWNAQCKVEEMTPAFIRQVENSDDLVLNTFRFGIGDSFQDFEEAQYYFPLTDQACYINSRGTVDRYILYAIPNSIEGDGPMCGYNGNTHIYTCSENDEIDSYSYFDCASRCALDYYGYEPEIDPFNPYLSLRPGSSRKIGNPFSYGVGIRYENDPRGVSMDDMDVGIGDVEGDEDSRPTVDTGGIPLVSGQTSFVDEYPMGTVLYGATFGYDQLSSSNIEQFFTELKEDEGGGDLVPEFRLNNPTEHEEDFLYGPYGQDAAEYLYYDWYYEGGNNDNRARTVFFTQEENSHAIYPWLLAHHSVYNRQFEEGHYLADGSLEQGAEYECLSSSECLSGYCNDFDYSRGVCVDVDGNDILCDCRNEGGAVVCLGAAAVDVPSWDRPGTDVEVPYALPALVDNIDEGNGLASLPSIGRVHMISFTKEGGKDQEPISEIADEIGNPIPVYFQYVGGAGMWYNDFDGFGRVSPDYDFREWSEVPLYTGTASHGDTPGSHDGDVSQIDLFMNPCGMLPDGRWDWWSFYWGSGDDQERYFECCNDRDCCTLANGFDSEDPDHHCAKYPFASTSLFDGAPPEAGTYSTRFMENCMSGYEEYIHLCFSKDADGQVGNKWGWDLGALMGNPTELYEALMSDPDEHDLVSETFCEYLGQVVQRNEGDEGNADTHINCYLWESGGYYPQSNSDKCVMEAETYIAIEPRWVEEANEGAGGWAFGRCMLNSQGDDLETKEYGMCESCGFLTMAKEQITAITNEYPPEDGSDLWEGLFDYQADMYGNTYCPDMVISTPYTLDTLRPPEGVAEDEVEDYSARFFYGLEIFGMNGYNQYLFGSSVWGGNHDLDKCTYPNGYTMFDYEAHENDLPAGNTRQRGLPYTYPNAYYINTKLETMMKRNIQPVLFASDWELWDPIVPGPDEDEDIDETYSVVIKLENDGDIDWATNELMPDLYLNRNYLFIGNSDTDPEDDNVIYSTGSFLTNTMINEGGAILVTYLGERETSGTDCSSGDCEIFPRYNHGEIIRRGRATRLLCPNCMIAVGAGYDGGYHAGGSATSVGNPLIATLDEGFNLDNRREEINALFEDDEAADFVDVIALNVQLSDEDDYCDMNFDTEEEKFEYIIGELQGLGSWTLSTYGKPLIITDLRIDYHRNAPSSCWDDEVAGRFMAYTGENANKLAKAGYLGVIYGSWDAYGLGGVRDINEAGVENFRGDFFGGVFAAARNFAGQSFTIYYSESQVNVACPCVPCSPADNPSECNGHFNADPNMPLCVGYQDGMKWADGCVSEDVCYYPSVGVGTQVGCDILYNNGTRAHATYEMDDIAANPSAYRDVIGSLESPYGEKYCFVLDAADGTSVTYTMTDQYHFDSTPAVFSMEGDLIVECDPTETLLEPFCGYIPPISNYRMECEIG